MVETSGLVEAHRSQEDPIGMRWGRTGAGSKGAPVRCRLQRASPCAGEACLCGTGRLRLRMRWSRGRVAANVHPYVKAVWNTGAFGDHGRMGRVSGRDRWGTKVRPPFRGQKGQPCDGR